MIKDLKLGYFVKGDKRVEFSFYRDGELWYRVKGTDFEFPISGEDLKGAIFYKEDKAILFMRWIRKHIKFLKDSVEKECIHEFRNANHCVNCGYVPKE